MVIFFAMSADLLTEIYFDKSEHGVVNHIHVVRVNTFGNDGMPFITLYLLRAVDLHQDKVCVGANAHRAPCLIIVVVLSCHELQSLKGILVV